MRFIFIPALLISTSVLACPDLAGTYSVCRSTITNDTVSTDVEVTQKVQNGVMVYTITATDAHDGDRSSDTYKADGKVTSESQVDPQSGEKLELTRVAICGGTQILNIKETLTLGTESMYDGLLTVTKAGNSLTLDTKGTAFGEAFSEHLICE